MLNPFLKFQGFGFNNIGTAFLMPLSPSHLLIVYDGTLYSNNIEKVYIESNNAKEVLDLNKTKSIYVIKSILLKKEWNQKKKKEW